MKDISDYILLSTTTGGGPDDADSTDSSINEEIEDITKELEETAPRKKITFEATEAGETPTMIEGGPGKNPAIAYVLSQFVCGLGQIYNGRIKRGFVLFLLWLILGAGVYVLLAIPPGSEKLGWITGRRAAFAAFIIGFLTVVIWSWSILSAYNYALKTSKTNYRGFTNRFLTPLLSIICPGLGQAAGGRFGSGAFYAFFLFIGLAAVFFLAVTFHNWHLIAAAGNPVIVEKLALGAVAGVCAAGLFYLINIFDAIAFGSPDGANALFGGLFQVAKYSVAVVAMLIIAAILTPRSIYVKHLGALRDRAESAKMVYIPSQIQSLSDWIEFGKAAHGQAAGEKPDKDKDGKAIDGSGKQPAAPKSSEPTPEPDGLESAPPREYERGVDDRLIPL